MDKCIIIDSGTGVGVCYPSQSLFEEGSDEQKLAGVVGATEEQILEFVVSRSVPEGANYAIIPVADLPTSRFFREAWVYNTTTHTLEIDLLKAKEIKRTQFRILRKDKLDLLDIQFMKALETGASTAEIIAKKQALRDITNITLPDDLTELEAFMPEVLND